MVIRPRTLQNQAKFGLSCRLVWIHDAHGRSLHHGKQVQGGIPGRCDHEHIFSRSWTWGLNHSEDPLKILENVAHFVYIDRADDATPLRGSTKGFASKNFARFKNDERFKKLLEDIPALAFDIMELFADRDVKEKQAKREKDNQELAEEDDGHGRKRPRLT